MPEMILPGVYIEVRPEGLIIPGQVTVGNIGIVGTASKGKIGELILLGSYGEAVQKLGPYDAWPADATAQQTALTLTRALELAYNQGATTVYAVRVAKLPDANTQPTDTTVARSASVQLTTTSGVKVTLTAKSEGIWGNGLSYNVSKLDSADPTAVVENEHHTEGDPITLLRKPVAKDARNLIQIKGRGRLNIVYDLAAGQNPQSGEVNVVTATGELKFPAGESPTARDTLTATYAVKNDNAFRVTLRLGRAEEVYSVTDGTDLFNDIMDPNSGSAWVDASTGDPPAASGPLTLSQQAPSPPIFTVFSGGQNGEGAAITDYQAGLDALLYQNVHIIVAAGQDESFGNRLDTHCQVASTDVVKHDRIAVVGSALFSNAVTLDTILGHQLDSDRVIFVTPGIKTTDAVSRTPVKLPGTYTAAAIAGLLARYPAHISLTNKVLSVDDLEQLFTDVELSQLLQARVMPVEVHLGIHIVRGITTSTNTAWKQITTRRIVDYAKFGVRSAAQPYIGLLNNERVRGALRTTINSFLAGMVNDEMLISYDLNVTATRQQEIQGIVAVTMVLRPVFSIDFIVVTMFLE